MTDALANAMEAAARRVANDLGISWGGLNDNARAKMRKMVANAIATRDATMAEAGWVMVRAVGEARDRSHIPNGPIGSAYGWNACRAAMMKGSTDEQG